MPNRDDPKRFRISHLIEAPSEPQPSSLALCDAAAPLARGHPFLARFAPGSQPASDTSGTTLSLSQDGARNNVRLDLATPDARYRAHLHPPSEYMVAVVDTRSGLATVVEAAGEFLLTRATKTLSATASPSTRAEKTYREKRGELLGEFGGKKAKERQAKIDRNTITGDNVGALTARQLEDVIDSHRAVSGTTSLIVPPHDTAAERVEDAYPLLGLMGAVEYGFLSSEAKAALASVDKGAEGVDRFNNPGWQDVCWGLMVKAVLHAEEGQDSKKERQAERERRVMAAMYLHYLFVLASSSAKKIDARARKTLMKDMAVSADFLECLLERFSDISEGTRVYHRSNQSTTRLMYYAVVLWLTASGFSISSGFDDVARALGMPAHGQLLVHFKHLGCKVKRVRKIDAGADADVSYRVTLSVPLTFPELRKARLVQKKNRL